MSVEDEYDHLFQDYKGDVRARIENLSKDKEQYQFLMNKYYVKSDKNFKAGKMIYEHMKRLKDQTFTELVKDPRYNKKSCVQVLYYLHLMENNKRDLLLCIFDKLILSSAKGYSDERSVSDYVDMLYKIDIKGDHLKYIQYNFSIEELNLYLT